MRYKDYIKQLEQLPHKDNNGKSLAELNRAFDDYSVDQAEKRY